MLVILPCGSGRQHHPFASFSALIGSKFIVVILATVWQTSYIPELNPKPYIEDADADMQLASV